MVSDEVVVPAFYSADVTHTRRSPIAHSFRYRAAYWLVDFDQLPQPRGAAGWGTRVRPKDHMDIRQILAEQGVEAGRILMLSGARVLGYAFNPISVYWCYDDTPGVCAVVIEVRNTYGSSHAYVVEPSSLGEATVEKAMPVSPFNAADGTYRIRIGEPGSSVSVTVRLERPDHEPFVATLEGKRRPVTWGMLAPSFLYLSGLRTRMLIQYQGVRLWARGLKVQPR
jgi:uncharacterized protein